jgi:putative FmdB family regulatory protein
VPLYDFRCRTCGHEFEALQRRPDDHVECPACRGGDFERLLSTFATASEERSRAAVKKERQRQIRGRRDALIAEEEYRQKHDKE